MLVCPMCGWEARDELDKDNVGPCRKCREYVVFEEDGSDPDLIAEIQADFDREQVQDDYEANSENYGYDDEFNYRDKLPFDGEIF